MTIELIAVVLCSMVIHEWAHASAADLEGDPVPRDMGRLTLNPFAHLDPFAWIRFRREDTNMGERHGPEALQ